MSNVYTKPSISGYNTNPPPDDQSTGSDNVISWSKHTGKIGNPLKNYADAINNNVYTAFGEIAFNTAITKTGAYTVQTVDRGALISCSGTFTVSLLEAATATEGFNVTIANNGTGTITIDGDTSELINGASTLVLDPNTFAICVCDGTAWYAATNNLPVISNYQAGHVEWIYDDAPDATELDLTTITDVTWESIGPTGSGADNIWTALDSIPVGAKWVEVKIVATTTSSVSADTVSLQLYCRANGSSAGLTSQTMAFHIGLTIGGASSVVSSDIKNIRIPLDSSNTFDVYRISGSTINTFEAHLIGFGR